MLLKRNLIGFIGYVQGFSLVYDGLIFLTQEGSSPPKEYLLVKLLVKLHNEDLKDRGTGRKLSKGASK